MPAKPQAKTDCFTNIILPIFTFILKVLTLLFLRAVQQNDLKPKLHFEVGLRWMIARIFKAYSSSGCHAVAGVADNMLILTISRGFENSPCFSFTAKNN